jgi:hypothetical protein
MVTENDDGNNIVKVYWKDIRDKVAEVEPKFAKIVDDLNPDTSYPLFLAYYPYGSTDADTESSLFPRNGGGFFRISDSDAPKEIVKHLGYSKNSTPLGMVLDKEIECFIDLKSEGITIPWHIYQPGSMFPFARILNKMSDRIYAPNGLLSSTAGARSAFMLPNIGCGVNHSNLQRDFNVQSPPPKSLYEHWHIFKEIVNSDVANSTWRCCVMYFSEKWLLNIHADAAWCHLKQYLHELAWYRYEWDRNRIYYDITFSIIQKKRNLKPNPYLADTAMHLFATALGAVPGYVPSLDNHALPLDILQKAFTESYGLKKYLPNILQPKHYKFETEEYPIYYSLQHPSTHVFSPRSRDSSSTLFEMRELEHLMRVYMQELTKKNELCTDTIIGKVADHITFQYYHNKPDRHRIVNNSSQLFINDNRFTCIQDIYKSKLAKHAIDAPFVRGCISITNPQS